MKTIDMRPKQNEKGRRKTFKDNYYFLAIFAII